MKRDVHGGGKQGHRIVSSLKRGRDTMPPSSSYSGAQVSKTRVSGAKLPRREWPKVQKVIMVFLRKMSAEIGVSTDFLSLKGDVAVRRARVRKFLIGRKPSQAVKFTAFGDDPRSRSWCPHSISSCREIPLISIVASFSSLGSRHKSVIGADGDV